MHSMDAAHCATTMMVPKTNSDPAKTDPLLKEGALNNASVTKVTAAAVNDAPRLLDNSDESAKHTNNVDYQSMATKPPSDNIISDAMKSHIVPLDIVAERKYYPHIFRDYTRLSARQKEILQAFKDPEEWRVPDGCCTKIMEADFVQTLCHDMNVQFTPSSRGTSKIVFMGYSVHRIFLCGEKHITFWLSKD